MDGVFKLTKIDPWFLVQIEELVKLEEQVKERGMAGLDADFLRALKRKGFADARLAKILGVAEGEVRKLRARHNIFPVYKRVDTCAAEFATNTAYMYSSYDEECEANPTNRDKIMVIGGGPNRIGQGIEFDYCCVHAALALREDGYETIMVNCNPETVSTDYDTSDRLYFEPVTLEDVLEIVRASSSPRASSSSTVARLARWLAPWKPTACRSSAPARMPSTAPKTASASSPPLSAWASSSRKTAPSPRWSRRC